MIVLVGVGLQSSGFTPNVAQSDATLLALRATFLVPFLAFLAAAWVLSGLRLDEAEHARIRAALDARAG